MKTIEVSGEAGRPARPSPLKKLLLGASLTLACTVVGGAAEAGGTINFGDGESITIGAGLRTSYTSEEDGAPNGTSRGSDFSLDSIRLYINGQITPYLKATFDTERNGDGDIDVLDGYVQFEPYDEFNVWVGRMLPPSDRSNLDGPYYLNTWEYPMVSQYPSKFDGRDDGVTIWGKLFEKKLVYSVGVFNGHNRTFGASNESDNMLFAGRVAYNFLDPEPDPAYYTSSTYYGSVNVLTLAVAGMHQSDGVGTATVKGDYNAWNVDGLYEQNFMDIGVVTLEGAYYQYDTGGVFDVGPGFGGAGATSNVGGINEGKAYLLDAAFLFPGKVGWGKFQPVIRYQEFDSDLTTLVAHQYDVGLNYIISGHNARLSLDWIKSVESGSNTDAVVFGIQAQI